MIYGIGTDIVSVARLQEMLTRFGDKLPGRILGAQEQLDFANLHTDEAHQARFLAKRFATKEAFAKALGTGLRAPILMPAIDTTHDPLGKPVLQYGDELAKFMQAHRLHAHLSVSDEAEYVVAFVMVEQSA